MVAPPPSPLRVVEVPVLSASAERFTHTIAINDEGSSIQSQSTIESSEAGSYKDKLKKSTKSISLVVLEHLRHHVGPGILASIAYFDPGNWAVDLQAGSQFGYKLLFVILLAGLGAVLLQTMAARLGCVTGRDLAEHCRILLYNRPKNTLLYRRLLLYPMYVICEIGIIATDLAELLGSAIGLTLLVPSIPLWASVLITSFDVIFVLALAPSSSGRPVRLFEMILMVLVFIVFGIFIVLLVKIKPNAGDLIVGYFPSKTLFQSGALYTSIASSHHRCRMPYSSAQVSQHSIASLQPPSLASLPTPNTTDQPLTFWQKINKLRKAMVYVERKPPGNPLMNTKLNDSGSVEKESETTSVSSHSNDDELASPTGKNHPVASRKYLNNSIEFITAHLGHAIIDIVMSLLGFAVVINSAILILAAAAFFYSGRSVENAGLFDAYDLIKQIIGKPSAIMFAVALLCSGQSASITATLAGQIVSEGFIEWRISPLVRRVITRLIGLVPSTIVAVTVGRQGIDILLVASQVALSIVLPFVIFPLVYLTSQESVMQVAKPEGGTISYKSHIATTIVGYTIFAVVLVANSYVLVSLMMGKSG
ncbi:hypothetical protein OPQ81_002147 [Rhizoctonia solani]|nr:hypothetical protein OPQ81_002147 [Rhizoctonia solani]